MYKITRSQEDFSWSSARVYSIHTILDLGLHWKHENQSRHKSPFQIHQWQSLVLHASETKCCISYGISMIVFLTLLQPNIVDMYSAGGNDRIKRRN